MMDALQRCLETGSQSLCSDGVMGVTKMTHIHDVLQCLRGLKGAFHLLRRY